MAHPGPAVVITRRACVLLPEEKAKDRIPYWVDEEACIQCDYCMESGCPALVMAGEYPAIRDWECIGCAICAQLCPVDAILPVEASAGLPAGEV
jgi:indolepyruvate ferredoxin oxidoreductase alpha subunit